MTPVDIAIVAVIVLSALLSLLRGAVREVLSLAAWAAAFAVAVLYADRAAGAFSGFIGAAWLRYVVAFALLLVGAVLAASLVGRLVALLVKRSGLGWTDRLLGVLFGAARGAVLVAILTVPISAMPVQQEAWWKESRLLPYFNGAAQQVMHRLPHAGDAAGAVTTR